MSFIIMSVLCIIIYFAIGPIDPWLTGIFMFTAILSVNAYYNNKDAEKKARIRAERSKS